MIVTFALLNKALEHNRVFSIPLVIVLDIIAAAVLACFSLYFGLLNTHHEITVTQTAHILYGKSLDNSQFEFSPYFWAMHTTFIPTLLYLILILICWSGKALLLPVKFFLGKGQEHKNPLKLTATLFGVFAAIFAVLFFAATSVNDKVNLHSLRFPNAIESKPRLPTSAKTGPQASRSGL